MKKYLSILAGSVLASTTLGAAANDHNPTFMNDINMAEVYGGKGDKENANSAVVSIEADEKVKKPSKLRRHTADVDIVKIKGMNDKKLFEDVAGSVKKMKKARNVADAIATIQAANESLTTVEHWAQFVEDNPSEPKRSKYEGFRPPAKDDGVERQPFYSISDISTRD